MEEELVEILTKKQYKITTAESCTGGLVMAIGCAAHAKAQVGISTTGIAGPGGGTAEKPVGLVYIGCAVRSNVYVEKNVFSGDRQQVRRQAADRAIGFALECIKKESV